MRFYIWETYERRFYSLLIHVVVCVCFCRNIILLYKPQHIIQFVYAWTGHHLWKFHLRDTIASTLTIAFVCVRAFVRAFAAAKQLLFHMYMKPQGLGLAPGDGRLGYRWVDRWMDAISIVAAQAQTLLLRGALISPLHIYSCVYSLSRTDQN